MDIIIKNFLSEANDIENSSIFLEEDGCEPKTEWIEEIDSRTNFPFYWNSNTKESVWDMPKDYNEYLIKYEAYLRDLIVKCDEVKKSAVEDDNNKNINDMKGLIEYSDSEDDMNECEEVVDENDKEEDIVPVVEIAPEEVETEEDLLLKKEKWMNDQADEAEKYLKNLIRKLTETLKNKVEYLSNDNLATEQLKNISVCAMARLEDWTEGHLTLERKVEKLRESLIEISRFEAGLEADRWRLNWNSDKSQYFCTDIDSGKIISELSATKNCCEEGEIVEDEEDLALDLEEYVSTTLHRSLMDDDDDPIDWHRDNVAQSVDGGECSRASESPISAVEDNEGIMLTVKSPSIEQADTNPMNSEPDGEQLDDSDL